MPWLRPLQLILHVTSRLIVYLSLVLLLSFFFSPSSFFFYRLNQLLYNIKVYTVASRTFSFFFFANGNFNFAKRNG